MISKITKIEKFEKKKEIINSRQNYFIYWLKAMFEKARRNSRHGAPWLKACVSRHATPEARHGVMRGFCNTIFDLSYLFNVLFC
jgi:hypothetical protein